MKTMTFLAGFFCLGVAVAATIMHNIGRSISRWQWVVPITPDELLDN